jgi:G6PDH family F420-dependent oxidoreductase
MIAVEPNLELGQQFDEAGGAGKPRIGQVGICYDADEAAARKRAHEQFRWFAGGWEVMAELPGPDHFAAASQSVREEDIAGQVPCGPALDAHVEAVKQFTDAGFTHVAVVQIGGGQQEPFFEWAESELLPALRRQG